MLTSLKFIVVMTIACFIKHSYCTFGDEYVHIKVHVQKEHVAHAHIIEPDPKILPVPPHKVIHHYHHNVKPRLRPRPHRKPFQSAVQPISAPVLENIILSELDRPKQQHHDHHYDDKDHDNDLSNDYDDEQEEKHNHAKDIHGHIRGGPIEIEETFIIKTQNHVPHPKSSPTPPSAPPAKVTKVNTYKIIEEKPKAQDYVHEEHEDDFEEFPAKTEAPPASHVETIKLIESFGPNHRHFYNHNYAELQKHEYKEAFDYEKKKSPHTQTFKVIETHEHPGNEVYRQPPPPKVYLEEDYDHDHHQSNNIYTEPAPIVEIIESDHHEHHDHGYHYGEPSHKEEELPKHYFYHKTSAKPNEYHHYYHHHGHINFIKPPTIIEPIEHNKHNKKIPHYYGGDIGVTATVVTTTTDNADGSHSNKANDDGAHGHSDEGKHNGNGHGGEVTQSNDNGDAVHGDGAQGNDPSYSSNKRTAYGFDTFRPSAQMPSNDRPSSYHSIPGTINYVNDDVVAAVYKAKVKNHASNIEYNWPEPAGYNSAAPETYSGIDSYSVGHVQGLGSAGYKYPAPYP